MWIEISKLVMDGFNGMVTPFAGVWIEIALYSPASSLINVTPFAGVWIEIVVPGGIFG